MTVWYKICPHGNKPLCRSVVSDKPSEQWVCYTDWILFHLTLYQHFKCSDIHLSYTFLSLPQTHTVHRQLPPSTECVLTPFSLVHRPSLWAAPSCSRGWGTTSRMCGTSVISQPSLFSLWLCAAGESTDSSEGTAAICRVCRWICAVPCVMYSQWSSALFYFPECFPGLTSLAELWWP